nr:ribbon-helix-helix domain-containing protein [Mesorhizobium loti]
MRHDLEPEFRVVVRNGQRRGIRLERGFWDMLKRMATRNQATLGALVDQIAAAAGADANLTSAIRVACLHDASDENAMLRRLTSIETIKAILFACPAPAFALESTRKILTFNPPFQNLVRRQLPVGLDDDARKDMKLALDLSVADILERLRQNGNLPVGTGFVIGIGERRHRGQINAVRAPVPAPDLLLAFVVNG